MPERKDVTSNPSMRDAGHQGIHELGRDFRTPPNPAAGYSAADNHTNEEPAFIHPNPTGAPDVQRMPHAERDQVARLDTIVSDAEGDWLNFRHPLGIAGATFRPTPPPPDRPAHTQVAMTLRPFDKGMGSGQFAGGLHGVVPTVDGAPRGRQNPIDVERPTFRVPPRPWEESITPIGG